MGQGLKIVVASSGLGHVSHGIEAWANDLSALGEQSSVSTCFNFAPRPSFARWARVP